MKKVKEDELLETLIGSCYTGMNKSFFEVFPTLKVNEDIQLLFQGVEVAKVATNTMRDFIKVHILSTHLIQKQRIYEIEKMLKEQVGKNHIQVQLVEQYDLSAQYTLRI